MNVSHIHISFKDFSGAIVWFSEVLDLKPKRLSKNGALFSLENMDLALHPDWGDGDTAMTLAFKTENCEEVYSELLKKGAQGRTPPRDKGATIGADVFGPGRVVVELEQEKLIYQIQS